MWTHPWLEAEQVPEAKPQQQEGRGRWAHMLGSPP